MKQKTSIYDEIINCVSTWTMIEDSFQNRYFELNNKNSGKRIVSLADDEIVSIITYAVWKTAKTCPTDSQVAQALRCISQFKPKLLVKELFQRFGADGQNHYIDLGWPDGSAVEVQLGKWSVTASHPVKFLRGKNTDAMPIPLRGGDLKHLLKYLNLSGENQEMLLLASLCSFPLIDMERPILGILGPQGSAKTTAARLVRSVVDPCSPLENDFEPKARDLAIVFHHNAVPLFDNLIPIKPYISAMFCKAISGTGHSARALFTNAGMHTIMYRRGFLFTAIQVPSLLPDFIDRCVLIELDRIENRKRLPSTELNQAFRQDLPGILGGMLDTVAAAKALLPELTFPRGLPRLADFARYGEAVCQVLGYGQGRFLDMWFDQLDKQKAGHALGEEPYAHALLDLMEDREEFAGTTKELLDELGLFLPNDMARVSPEALGKALNRTKGTLGDLGILVDNSQRGIGGRQVHITKKSEGDETREKLATRIDIVKAEGNVSCKEWLEASISAAVRCMDCCHVEFGDIGFVYCRCPQLNITENIFDEVDVPKLCAWFEERQSQIVEGQN